MNKDHADQFIEYLIVKITNKQAHFRHLIKVNTINLLIMVPIIIFTNMFSFYIAIKKGFPTFNLITQSIVFFFLCLVLLKTLSFFYDLFNNSHNFFEKHTKYLFLSYVLVPYIIMISTMIIQKPSAIGSCVTFSLMTIQSTIATAIFLKVNLFKYKRILIKYLGFIPRYGYTEDYIKETYFLLQHFKNKKDLEVFKNVKAIIDV